jgi:uncharacterized membrane protein YhaH (DUF805 family)
MFYAVNKELPEIMFEDIMFTVVIIFTINHIFLFIAVFILIDKRFDDLGKSVVVGCC